MFEDDKRSIQVLISQIELDEARNRDFLHITANENQMSHTARKFLGSKINERYYMGGGLNGIVNSPENFTALGFPGVEELINTAQQSAKKMLGAYSVNLNVLSGVHAMMSAILSTTEPGDMVMTVREEDGGHFATKGIVERTGRKHIFADFDIKTLKFDAIKIAENFKKFGVKALYLDVSYYLNPHNLREIRMAVGDDPIIIYDASHTMGLIMGQQFQSPFEEGANVICANTHKTLPGPHKGMIAFRDADLSNKANSVIDSCLYSTSHITHLIALSVTILEMDSFGKEYARQIIANSNAIASAFANLGYEVRKANTGRYSENHQAHVFLDNKGEMIELYEKLVRNKISTNFESHELSGGRLFMRVGTQEITRRGMKENEMEEIAGYCDRAFKGGNVTEEIDNLSSRFTTIKYSFDS